MSWTFWTCLFQDYEERIASLQEQVERNSMMSSIIRFDVEEDDNECKSNTQYQQPAVQRQMIMYSVESVCLFVCV